MQSGRPPRTSASCNEDEPFNGVVDKYLRNTWTPSQPLSSFASSSIDTYKNT